MSFKEITKMCTLCMCVRERESKKEKYWWKSGPVIRCFGSHLYAQLTSSSADQ